MTAGVVSRRRALDEVLGLPIRLLRGMPLPTTLVCSFAHEGGCVVLATAPPSSVPGDPPAPVFVGQELEHLTLAAEHGRATHVELAQWHAYKLADRHWRLDAHEALGGLPGFCPARGWTIGQVFRALGLRLDEVRL